MKASMKSMVHIGILLGLMLDSSFQVCGKDHEKKRMKKIMDKENP